MNEQVKSDVSSRWVWCSTPDSYARSAVSVLAIFETLLCMLAYAHVAVTYGTLHLTLAVLIAPMLLLRTDESVRFALYYSKSLQDNVLRERSSNPSYIRQTFACLPALGAAILLMFMLAALIEYLGFFPERKPFVAPPVPTIIIGARAPAEGRQPDVKNSKELSDYLSQMDNIDSLNSRNRELLGDPYLNKKDRFRQPQVRNRSILDNVEELDRIAQRKLEIPRKDRVFWRPLISIALTFLLLLAGASLLRLMLAPLLLRIIGTLHGVYVDPIRAITNIPSNWWHHVACLDTMHPPEVLPGAIIRDRQQHKVTPLQPFEYFLIRFKVFGPFDNAFLLLFSAIPAYLFRWSLKGTSLMLLPLVWLVFDAKNTKPEYFIKSSLVKALYKLSCLILVLTAGGILHTYIGVDFGLLDPLKKITHVEDKFGVVTTFFPNTQVPLWQLLLLATSIGTISVFLFAERLSNRGQYTDFQRHCFQCSLVSIGFFAVALIFSLVYTAASLAAL